MPVDKDNNTCVTLKVQEAAKIARCGTRAIRKGVADGTIPSIRLSRNILIPRAAFLRLLETGRK